MLKTASITVICLILNGVLSIAPAQELGYTLNPGDVLRISVWREDALDREALVQPDGTVSFPLVGQVAAAGHTTGQVAEAIGGEIDMYIPEAMVSVELLEALGNSIYVIGEVNRPGQYQLTGATTVVQAVSLAGGFTPFASTSRIRVLRIEGDNDVTYRVDYDDIEAGEQLESNMRLKAGDTVMVPGGSLF